MSIKISSPTISSVSNVRLVDPANRGRLFLVSLTDGVLFKGGPRVAVWHPLATAHIARGERTLTQQTGKLGGEFDRIGAFVVRSRECPLIPVLGDGSIKIGERVALRVNMLMDLSDPRLAVQTGNSRGWAVNSTSIQPDGSRWAMSAWVTVALPIGVADELGLFNGAYVKLGNVADDPACPGNITIGEIRKITPPKARDSELSLADFEDFARAPAADALNLQPAAPWFPGQTKARAFSDTPTRLPRAKGSLVAGKIVK